MFSSSVGVTKISVKTGNQSSAESDAVADLQICDGFGACCQTLGLDNAGNPALENHSLCRIAVGKSGSV